MYDVLFLDEDRLDILVNNAGVMMHPEARTEEGFEMHYAVNFLGNKPVIITICSEDIKEMHLLSHKKCFYTFLLLTQYTY